MPGFHDFGVLRENILCAAGLPLAGMGAHLNDGFFRCFLFFHQDFRFIEQKTQLADHFLRRFLGRRVKQFALDDAQLLKKPFILLLEFLQFLVFRAGNGHRFRGSCLQNRLAFHALSIP